MRRACLSVLAGSLLGCGPQTSTQPPEPAAASEAAAPAEAEGSSRTAEDDAGSADAAPGADAPAPAGAPEPEPAAAGIGSHTITTSGDPGGLAAADGGDAPDDPEAGPTPEPEQPPSQPTVTKLELPKPLHGKADASCGNDAGVGERLKSFSLPGLGADETITQSTFKGRVLVVNFWGTWCKPCLKELPEFDQLYRRYRKLGMTLLAIATDEDAQAVEDLVAEKKWGAKIAVAGEAYAGQYGSPKFPFTFVVDHTGVIKASYRGYKPECMGQLEADIREQLEARHAAKAKRKKG